MRINKQRILHSEDSSCIYLTASQLVSIISDGLNHVKDLSEIKIEFESSPCYDSATGNLLIFYESPETEQEKNERENAESERQRKIRIKELAQLEVLQLKYGDIKNETNSSYHERQN